MTGPDSHKVGPPTWAASHTVGAAASCGQPRSVGVRADGTSTSRGLTFVTASRVNAMQVAGARTVPAATAGTRPARRNSTSTTDEVRADADPWAWLDEAARTARPPSTSPALHVTAVLVTLDAARWLPATLDGLARLQHRPTRLIAIDNASTDATRALLERGRDQGVVDAVYTGKRRYGFGAAVKSALRQDRPSSRGPSTPGARRIGETPLALAAARRCACPPGRAAPSCSPT